ncbi:DUF3291 domain-containing protein [Marinigracilibium pacificum]|uniref:DUF3291 domain-containing protein n=1 Tax=Marinigracilibium pacificum TaxID=2729599 RepID=A0A848J3V7_9BACT|nr:DUF3291 domain-containing protein [Marinigracilibium pacificum]NMM49039.1 DUF3291 domain-containing protein [Marinigracilibium pacificum]
MSKITSVCFMRFKGFKNKLKAMTMMNEGHGYLQKDTGDKFYKLMGSGAGNGFIPYPDWSVFSLITTWDTEEDAYLFNQEGQFFKEYDQYISEKWTCFLFCIQSHGNWEGQEPFEVDISKQIDNDEPIAVLTRATIKTSSIIDFWSHVSGASAALKNNPDLIYAKGVGIFPFTRMATFSIWKSLEGMKSFAYNKDGHKQAMQKAKSRKWFEEDLFARFIIYDAVGEFEGIEFEKYKKVPLSGEIDGTVS